MSRISKLKICEGIPFGLNDGIVLTFNSYEEQAEFFDRFTKNEFDDLSFVKGFFNKKIKVDAPIEDLYNANYVVFNNEDYGDKNFFAYITDFEYISDNCTGIVIEMDYFQTYMGDIVFLATDIDRQMTRDDNFENIYIQQPEPIQISRYYIADVNEVNFTNWSVCVLYKPNLVVEGIKGFFNFDDLEISGDDTYNYRDLLNDSKYKPDYNIGSYVEGKYMTGCATKIYPINNQNDLQAITTKLWLFELTGYSVVDVYMIPSFIADFGSYENEYDSIKNPYWTDGIIPQGKDYYIPNNNKTFLSPYIYLELSNYMGGIKNYTYQQFFINTDTDEPNFKFRFIASNLNGFTGYIYPISYGIGNGEASYRLNFENGLNLADTAHINWNENKIGQELIKGTIGTVVSATGAYIAGSNITGAIAGEAINKQNQTGEYDTKSWKRYLEENEKMQKNIHNSMPTFNDVANAITNGDGTRQGGGNAILNTIFDFIGFKFTMYCAVDIKEIDNFFSMYGYAWNRIDILNILGNDRFNYVKTKNARIAGDIPIYAKEKIIDMLNNGITFWHDLENFQYSFLDNFKNGKELTYGRIFIR